MNELIYIGKSTINDPNYLGSGLKIVNAINKYGRENFSKNIIEECEDSVASQREIYWIQYFNSINPLVGYNLSKGGTGGTHYWDTLNEEQRKLHNEKISRSKLGKPRAPHSAQTKQKMSDSFNRDPIFLSRRANLKCKTFTCINHSTGIVFHTTNLKHFCLTHTLTYANMLYNASTRKTFTEQYWSCRKGVLDGDIKTIIETEIYNSLSAIKEKTGRYDRTGNKNPMYGKNHSESTKNKIRESKLKK